MVFVPGKKNTLPDGLSRFPIQGPSIYDAEEVQALSITESNIEDSNRPIHLTAFEGRALVVKLEEKGEEWELASLTQDKSVRRSQRIRQPRQRERVADFRLKRKPKPSAETGEPDRRPQSGKVEASSEDRTALDPGARPKPKVRKASNPPQVDGGERRKAHKTAEDRRQALVRTVAEWSDDSDEDTDHDLEQDTHEVTIVRPEDRE